MKRIQFYHGIVEVYDTEEEMIGILSVVMGKEEVELALRDNRFKDIFNPNAERNYYIKKIVAIKAFNVSYISLMCFEHWNYEQSLCSDKKVELNINTYSSGFACTSFKRPDEEVQKCFIEYYDTVRDDDRVEKILNTLKVGGKLYVKSNKDELSSETINYIRLNCYQGFVVRIGTNEYKEVTFDSFNIDKNGCCESYREEQLFISLESAKKYCLKILEERKMEYNKKIAKIEEKITNIKLFT